MEAGVLTVSCPGIQQGKFHISHTGRGQDLSPELVLEGLSPAAVTLAVVLEDMSHPIRGFTHWVIWNLPVSHRTQAAPGKEAQLPLHRLCPGLRPGPARRCAEKKIFAGGRGAHPPAGERVRGV